MNEVYVVMAYDNSMPVDGLGQPIGLKALHCVCDSEETAYKIIEKDTGDGHILHGAHVVPTVVQTDETV